MRPRQKKKDLIRSIFQLPGARYIQETMNSRAGDLARINDAEMIIYKLNQLTKFLFLRMGYRIDKCRRVYFKKSAQTLIVECVGAPGSGKTTTLDAFYKIYKTEIEKIRPNPYIDRRFTAGPVDSCHLEIITKHAMLGLAEQQHYKRNLVNYDYLRHLVEGLRRSEHYMTLGGIVIEDEGLFKKFPRTMLSYLNDERHANPAWLARRAFIIFETSPAYKISMHHNRKLNRVWNRRKRSELKRRLHKSIDGSSAYYSWTLGLWLDIKAHLEKRGIPYIVLDPKRGVKFNAGEIRRFVGEIAGTAHL